MNARDLLHEKTTTLRELLDEVAEVHLDEFDQCAKVASTAIASGRTIYWCGNGGSAAESSHLAVELIGRFKNNRRPLPSISLNSDTSAITCIANDFGFEDIFCRQLEGLAIKDDVLIVLSTSGNSTNILKVLQKARELGVHSIALLGKEGGEAKELADLSIIVNSHETARIQEIHLLLGHTICEFIEMELGFE